jgi:signal transduction histidine kinase/CheY-like chemotaxis protein
MGQGTIMAMNRPAETTGGWVVGGGEMGERIRALDWSRTPLGPLDRWPQALRTAVSMMLPSRAQIILFWGPQFVVLYNDAYRPVFGGKHPTALGLTGSEAWSEIWDDQLGPLLRGVAETGEAFWASDLLFSVQRHGYLEETYFDISYDPVRDETGSVAGVYCIVTETTSRVSGARRLGALSDLGRIGATERTMSSVFASAARVLGERSEDIAFALLYDWNADHSVARLRALAGIDAAHPAALSAIRLGQDSPWPLDDRLPAQGVVLEGAALAIEDLPGGRWPEPCSRVAVIPMALPSQAPDGFIVAGLSPRRVPDDAYRDFLRLVAASIGSALSNAKALEAERDRVQALAELDRAKTAFFSNVSHEFRTPLTLLLGPLREELAHGTQLPEASRERIAVAYRNGLRLLKLVNALLDFSRIEAGRMRARFEKTDLASFTMDLASNFRSACESANLALSVRCGDAVVPALVDRDMWEKIVFNLLSNAFKFTFEGGIEVRLSTDDEHAVLTVRDSGVGIPAEAMPRIFERFHRVESARSRTHEGSGIGLALVQELVHLHGGTIRADSQAGQGSVFEVRIPLGMSHLPRGQIVPEAAGSATSRQAAMFVQEALGWLRMPSAPDLPDAEPAAGAARRERILVAEDNADMREYLQRLLSERWDVIAVADGNAAVRALYTARFDLVLTDVMMPGLDGFGVLKAVRSDQALRDLPVVMLSARAGEEAAIEGRSAGADDYLVKPFGARELVARVMAQLAVATVRRAAARERELLLANERAARMDAERQWEDLVRFFEQAPNPMVILRGPEHLIELANPAACRVWGRTLDQVRHKPILEALPETRGQGLEAILDGVLESGEPFSGPRVAMRIDRGSGPQDMLFDVVYSPLRGPGGNMEGVMLTALDVTQLASRHKELDPAT